MGSQTPASVPPGSNILVVMADDLGIDFLRSYGAGENAANTPTLDALVAKGVRFENAWSYPLCSPTRAAVQSGRYGFRSGMGWLALWGGMPGQEILMPSLLEQGSQGRFATAAIGKWHLGRELTAPNDAGYGHFSGVLRNLHGENSYFNWKRVVNGREEDVTDRYVTSAQVDDAIGWIEGVQEPWFLHLGFSAPHKPFHAPPDRLHSVDLEGAGDPEVDAVPYFRAMVEAIDTELGRLLEALGPARERTTVIFLSDNGSPAEVVQEPWSPERSKTTLYEGALRVPLIISGGEVVRRERVVTDPVHVVDVFATVAEIAGIDPRKVLPKGHALDSRSLVKYLRPAVDREDLDLPRRYLLAERFFPNGPGMGIPLDPPPPSFLCQEDLGGSLGDSRPLLSMCGPPLAWGNAADLVLEGVEPGAPVRFFASFDSSPGQWNGLDLLPASPWAPSLLSELGLLELEGLFADAQGRLTLPALIGAGPAVLFVQAAVQDVTSGTWSASNALAIDFPPFDEKALRDERYKLIRSVNGGPEELYDLWIDPFENHDLLEDAALAPEASEALDRLRAKLDELVAGV